jgi:hypothetical protein
MRCNSIAKVLNFEQLDSWRRTAWRSWIRSFPETKSLHLVIDNYGTHKHPDVKAWLKLHPRFVIQFVPTSCGWLNLIERWFRELTDKRIRRDSFPSVPDLIAAIDEFLAARNEEPKPFVWAAHCRTDHQATAKHIWEGVYYQTVSQCPSPRNPLLRIDFLQFCIFIYSLAAQIYHSRLSYRLPCYSRQRGCPRANYTNGWARHFSRLMTGLIRSTRSSTG